jgi:hypothetical protein
MRIFTLPLPVMKAGSSGTILPEGQGVFTTVASRRVVLWLFGLELVQ